MIHAFATTAKDIMENLVLARLVQVMVRSFLKMIVYAIPIIIG